MSEIMEEGPLREIAILTRAVENVFRKLIRLLIGRMSLTKLQEMIRVIFVEEAEAKLKEEENGGKVSLTKLALLTGLDTRTLTRLNKSSGENLPPHKEERFLREITPECSILDYWGSNPDYLTKKSEIPKILDIRGGKPSFESLVKEVLTTRGVTTKSLLDRLESSKSIEIDYKYQKVKMLNRKYLPFEQSDHNATLEIGLISVGNLVDTIIHNIENLQNPENSFYQRASWTNRLNVRDKIVFRQIIRQHLMNAEEEARSILQAYEEKESDENQITAGVSLFYFEEEPI